MKRKKKYVDIDIQHPAPIFVEATVRINQESSLLTATAIAQLKDHGGSSSVSIRDHVQDNFPASKSFHNSYSRVL